MSAAPEAIHFLGTATAGQRVRGWLHDRRSDRRPGEPSRSAHLGGSASDPGSGRRRTSPGASSCHLIERAARRRTSVPSRACGNGVRCRPLFDDEQLRHETRQPVRHVTDPAVVRAAGRRERSPVTGRAGFVGCTGWTAGAGSGRSTVSGSAMPAADMTRQSARLGAGSLSSCGRSCSGPPAPAQGPCPRRRPRPEASGTRREPQPQCGR